MPAQRTTSLLSIKPAFVKGAEVVVPVMVHLGEWVEIAATPALWERIATGVAAAPARDAALRSARLARLGIHGLPKSPASAPVGLRRGEPITKPGGAIL